MTNNNHKCCFCNEKEGVLECTCKEFLCSKECVLLHTGGVTIEEMRELENGAI
jgi:hypothetical protein